MLVWVDRQFGQQFLCNRNRTWYLVWSSNKNKVPLMMLIIFTKRTKDWHVIWKNWNLASFDIYNLVRTHDTGKGYNENKTISQVWQGRQGCKFSRTLVIMSKFTACVPCAGLPCSGLAASRTCLNEVLSIGDGTPAMSCAHLTPYSAASIGEDELQDWNLLMK